MRNGTYGAVHSAPVRALFIKQCTKLAVSFLNWRGTNYLPLAWFLSSSTSLGIPSSEQDSGSTSHPPSISRHGIPGTAQGSPARPTATAGLKLAQQSFPGRLRDRMDSSPRALHPGGAGFTGAERNKMETRNPKECWH